jgi:hypothetical protein
MCSQAAEGQLSSGGGVRDLSSQHAAPAANANGTHAGQILNATTPVPANDVALHNVSSQRECSNTDARLTETANVSEPPTVQPLTVPRTLESVHNSEMHVAWRSEQLGRVDIRAEVHGHEIAAAVRVESDAGRQWLTSELPRLNDALNRQDLRVHYLEVGNFAHSGSQERGSDPQQRAWSSVHVGVSEADKNKAASISDLLAVEAAGQQGLSIHV